MERPAAISREALIQALLPQFERLLGQVADAVNQAPDGQWINASEEPVRDLLTEFRRQVFETAVQLRSDAAEAAFSPSARPHRPQAAQQGPAGPQLADGQRPP